MINRKISKILGPAFGVIGFMLAIGILETPALADDTIINSLSTYTTTSSAVTYKDYSINLNKSATQNGVKVTLEKVIATKHKLQASVRIESSTPFDQNKDQNYIVQLLYADNNYHGGSTSTHYIDDNTMLINIEQDNNNDDDEFPIKGNLRLDVVLPTYKVNIGIDAYADFSQSFDKSFHKDLSIKIPNSDYTLNKLDSDVLGTTINYNGPYTDHDDRYINSSFLLKVGEKIYKLHSSGSSSDGKKIEGTYETKALTYDNLKDEKSIYLIPLSSNITWNELDKIYENNNTSSINNNETLSNVNYDKSFNFSDGSKGEIYNIERDNTTVKIYCKGNSEKASLLIASGINIYYDFKEEQKNYDFYDGNKYINFYKDPDNSLGYIVEFSNVDKDKLLNLFFDSTITQIDRYTLGNEIQINH